MYGKANPILKLKKIGYVDELDSNNAQPIAAPIKGAVHGEATITAKTPVEKLENKEELFAELPNLVNERPKFISKRSTKPIIIISDDKIETTYGDWS